MEGIHAEVAVDRPSSCPLATTSIESGQNEILARSTQASGRVTEEFVSESDDLDSDDGAEFTGVFDYGDRHVYRFERDEGRNCPCENVELHGCPVIDTYAVDGTLVITFHAPDVETLQDVIAGVRGDNDSVRVERLVRSAEGDTSNLVLVDRSRLTDRQREVLKTAHEMGYFDHPKGANAGEIADTLDIAPSTFSEHLAAAQRKVMDAVLDA